VGCWCRADVHTRMCVCAWEGGEGGDACNIANLAELYKPYRPPRVDQLLAAPVSISDSVKYQECSFFCRCVSRTYPADV